LSLLSCSHAGYGLWCSVRFLGPLLSGRPWSIGLSRLRLHQSEKSCKQRFDASPVEDAGRSRKRCLARPSSRRGRPEASWRPRRALRSERRAEVGSERRSSWARPFGRRGGPESEAGVVPPRLGLPVGDLDRPFGMSFRYLGRPMSCASFATLSARLSLCWEVGP